MFSKVRAYEMANILYSQKEASCESSCTDTIDVFIIDQNDHFAALTRKVLSKFSPPTRYSK